MAFGRGRGSGEVLVLRFWKSAGVQMAGSDECPHRKQLVNKLVSCWLGRRPGLHLALVTVHLKTERGMKWEGCIFLLGGEDDYVLFQYLF